ncbi:MAG: hypothetical protein AAB074_03140 [Planctomycetota bacterium]
MKKLALVLAVALFAGCEEKKPEGTPSKAGEGSGSMPKPQKDGERKPEKEKPKVTRKVVDPSKAGQIATYKCECTKKEWTQPAEEEKLCIEYCEGGMPECGTLVKIEPAAK